MMFSGQAEKAGHDALQFLSGALLLRYSDKNSGALQLALHFSKSMRYALQCVMRYFSLLLKAKTLWSHFAIFLHFSCIVRLCASNWALNEFKSSFIPLKRSLFPKNKVYSIKMKYNS